MARGTWALALCETCLTSWWVRGQWEWDEERSPSFDIDDPADIAKCERCGSDDISVTGK